MKRLIHGFSEYVPLCMLALMLGAGLILTPQDLPDLTLCLFKKILLLDCPGCGMTRAFLSIPRGHLRRAFSYNPAAIPLYFSFLFVLLRWISFKWEVTRRVWAQISVPQQFGFVWFQIIVLMLVSNWIFKTYTYFSAHSWNDYVAGLSAIPLRDYSLMIFLFRVF